MYACLVCIKFISNYLSLYKKPLSVKVFTHFIVIKNLLTGVSDF